MHEFTASERQQILQSLRLHLDTLTRRRTFSLKTARELRELLKKLEERWGAG